MNCRKCKKEMPDGAPYCPWCGMKQERSTHVKQRGNGQGYAYKRGKTWTVCVTLGYTTADDGHTKRIERTKGGFKSKTEALSFAQALKGMEKEKKKPSLSTYWDIYSRGDMDKLSTSKYQAYTIAWNKMTKLAKMPVDQITISDLQNLIRTTCPTYYPARDAKSLLSHLFRLAAADGNANKDLPSFISLPEKVEQERQPFTDDEIALLWASYDHGDTDAAIPLIMIYTGLMPGEMRKLTAEMIHLDKRWISNVGIKTSIRKKVDVVLPDDICPVVEDVSKEKSGLIFPGCEQNFYDRYYSALEKAGITRHLTPYSCRHTTATVYAVQEKMPPQMLTRIMRWSTARMADRYVHPSNDAAVEAATMQRK